MDPPGSATESSSRPWHIPRAVLSPSEAVVASLFWQPELVSFSLVCVSPRKLHGIAPEQTAGPAPLVGPPSAPQTPQEELGAKAGDTPRDPGPPSTPLVFHELIHSAETLLFAPTLSCLCSFSCFPCNRTSQKILFCEIYHTYTYYLTLMLELQSEFCCITSLGKRPLFYVCMCIFSYY